ncbi:MATE family efflux transporter [Chloroflexota bacterium]
MRNDTFSRDWTEGSIVRNLWSLSWPMMISSSLMMLGPTIDMIWIGRLGSSSIAAVGVSGMAVMVANSITMGVFTGLRALVARFVGAGDIQGANHVTQQAYILGAGLAVIIAMIGVFFSEQILVLLGVEADVIELGAAYMRIQFIGMVTMSILRITEASMQASGDTITPMRISIFFRLLHVGLAPSLIFGWLIFPELGVRGAALTNVITQGIGGAIGMWFLLTGRTRMKLTFKNFSFEPVIIWRLVKIGIPAAITGMERSFANLMLVKFISPFGTIPVAAHSLMQRIDAFTHMPAMGFGVGAGVLTGQNLGAGKPERAERSGWIAAGIFTAIMACSGIAIWFLAPYIVRIFNSEPELVEIGASFLHIQIVGYLVFGCVIVLSQALNGAGDTIIPMLVTLLTMWFIQVPMAFFLTRYTGVGAAGVRWGIVTGMAVRAGIYTTYFKKGRWKRKKI